MGVVFDQDPNDRKRSILRVISAVRHPLASVRWLKRKVARGMHGGDGSPMQAVDGVSDGEDALFHSFARETVDREGYLRRFPDVKAAGIDPVAHWIEHGVFEGRWFADRLLAIVAEVCDEAPINAWKTFQWRGRKVSIVSTRPEDLSDAHDAEFIKFVDSHFDSKAYLERYPDVKASGGDPLEHWLQYGLYEGRFFSPGIVAKVDANVAHNSGKHWRRFKWMGRDVAIRTRQFRQTFMDQIEEQAVHDATVLAPGHLAIPFLPEFDGHDLLSRDGVDVRSVFRSIRGRPELILLTPFMCAGGAEKYAADLVHAFSELTNGRKLVTVTDQEERDAKGWQELNILAPFAKAQVVFWRNVCGPSYLPHVSMSRFINALRPRHLLVNNSRVGLDAVSTFGRGLSQNTSIFCTYFSTGVLGLGAPHGVRYPQRTLPFATALTDNQPMAETLVRQWGGISTHGIVVLSPRIEIASQDLFDIRLATRNMRADVPRHTKRWAWVSRVERFKGIAILADIAKLNPDDGFHIFGPLHKGLADLGLSLPNIHYEGVLSSVLESDFSAFDGFIFTSLFEGMPNVVLEMSQHAIPLVLADVGGLRSTFGEASAIFVEHAREPLHTARRFSDAMKRVSDFSAAERVAMVKSAYEDVRAKHGGGAYLQSVGKLLDMETARV